MRKEEGTRPIVLELIRQGHQLMRAGDPHGAAQKYLAAEQIAPDLDVLRRMHAQAEREAAELERLVGQEQLIASKILAATESMRSRRYADAMLAVAEALQMDPANPDAQQLLTQIKEAQARQAQAPQPGLPRPGAPEVQVPVSRQPDGTGTESPAEEARTATLTISVESLMPGGGSLMLFVNGEKRFQEDIPVPRKEGSFWNKKVAEPSRLTRTISVPASSGMVTLSTYVTPKGKSAVVKNLDGNFLGGSSRVLKIAVSPQGDFSPALN
jgi:hypothetical protein